MPFDAGLLAPLLSGTTAATGPAEDLTPPKSFRIVGHEYRFGRRHSYRCVATAGIGLVLTSLAVAGFSHSLHPRVHESFWQVVVGSPRTVGPYSFPIHADMGFFVVLAVVVSLPFIYVQLCRTTEKLFEPLDRVATTDTDGVQKRTRNVNKTFAWFGRKSTSLALVILGVLAALAWVPWIVETGPLRGLQQNVFHVRGTAIHISHQSVYWWMYPNENTAARSVCVAVLAWWIYIQIKINVLLIGTMSILDRASRTRTLVSVDIRNGDGHHGLSVVRSLLNQILLLSVLDLTALSVVLLIWRGPSRENVAIVSFVAVLTVVALGVPAYAVRSSIRRSKNQRLASVTLELIQIEDAMARAAYTNEPGGPAAADDRKSYWEILCDRQQTVAAVPLSGFRLRELGTSIVTLLLVPILVLVVGSLFS